MQKRKAVQETCTAFLVEKTLPMCYTGEKEEKGGSGMLPEVFLDRIKNQLGEEYPAFLESLERPRAVALRFNPLKGAAPQMDFVQDNVPWEENGYYYDPQARPGLHPYHEAGVYYLQEASAMSAVALLDPKPGEKVCDLCAAPGGKSTQIAGRLGGEGFLLCNEIHPKRAQILARNVERMGVANAMITNEHPARLAEKYAAYFDRVLIDAPCSGEGMFRKEEAAVTDWSQETVEMCARRQAEILHSGAALVKPGGRLVYSTCTFAPEENENCIANFLEDHPEFSLEPVPAPWFAPAGEGQFRLWPHKLLGEGHFVAVLRKNGGEEETVTLAKGAKLPKEWAEFAQNTGIALPAGKAVLFGQSLYWAPEELPDMAGIKVLRPGLELGIVKKDRFEPAHALALWLKTASSVHNLSSDSNAIRAYMQGQTVESACRGWTLVQVDGFSIGWGKGDGKVLKNHYPKGLRR